MFWIYFSDMGIGLFTNDSDQILMWQTYKGFFFIGVTAVLLYLLSYRILCDRYNEYKAYMDQEQKIQQQLTQQDALLTSLINSSPDAIVIKGLDRRYIVFNKGAYTLSGIDTNDAVGKTADEIFPKETAEIINRIDDDLLASNYFVEHEETMLMPNGKTYVYWVTKGLLKTQDGEIFGIFGIYRDITAMKHNEQIIIDEKERYDYMAHHDPLTGLPNRLSLIETLQLKSIGIPDSHFALMFLDLDGFKEINDSFGHRFGDQVLIQFSKLLEEIFLQDTLIIRTGGDEFVVLLESKFDQHSIQMYMGNLLQMLNTPFMIDQIEVYVTVSIGISL
jgi:diguanylate cyclase (GGDEF)-like protein/PAS domain S-box-containing protein